MKSTSSGKVGAPSRRGEEWRAHMGGKRCRAEQGFQMGRERRGATPIRDAQDSQDGRAHHEKPSPDPDKRPSDVETG